MKPYRLPLRKRLQNSATVRLVLTLLASIVLRVVFGLSLLMGRVERRIPEEAARYMRGEAPCILCFWHGRMLLMPFLKPRGRKIRVLISYHRDGALITDLMRWFGVGTVRGSSSRGAREALRGLLEAAACGNNLVITPDGPRGPYQEVAPGAIWVAMKTGLPLVPVSYSAAPRRHARSWDKFLLPLPLARVMMAAGSPITVAETADEATRAACCEDLQRALRELTQQLDHALDTPSL